MDSRIAPRRTLGSLATVLVVSVLVMPQGAVVDADALRVLPVTEELRIGNADDPKLGFGAIFGVDVDRDGQIFVYESQAREIRVFARDGRAVRTIGRAGSGPGEFAPGRFASVAAFGVLGDTVWTFGGTDRRVNLFRRDGSVVASRALEAMDAVIALHDSALGFISPHAMRSDGRFVSSVDYTITNAPTAARMLGGRGVIARPRATDTVRAPRVLFPVSGTVLDTIGWEPVPPRDGDSGALPAPPLVINGVRYSVPLPPGDLFHRISLADGSAIATRRRATSPRPAEFEVVRFDMAGKPMHRLRFRYTPGRYAGAILDTLAMRVARRGAEHVDAAFKAVRAKLAFPEFQAPVYAAWAANDNSLWVRREDNAGSHFRWIVIERSGAVRGIVAIPRTARPVWARGDTVLAIDTDDDGIPWLVRYRIAR